MKTIMILFIGLLVFTGTTLQSAYENADIVLYNGKIITVDAQDRTFQAVAIKGNKILALGTNTDILALAGPACKKIDLKGKSVSPGLIDSHYHMMYYGAQFSPGYLDIRYPIVKSKADLLKVVGDYAAKLKPGEWISGNQGFSLQPFETLDRWELDAVAPNNPTYLRHASGQYVVVNTKALQISGVTSKTPNPPGSLIMHDADGEPTGVLSHYPAENLVARYATGYGDRTDAQKFEDIERGQQLCLEAGYTSIQDVIVGSSADIQLYKKYAETKTLKVRLYALLLIDFEQEVDPLIKEYQKPPKSGLFRFGGWKLAMDGGLSARTTLFYDKTLYASQISYPYHPQDELNRMVKKLHNSGLQIAVHVGGDEGIDMTLNALELAMQENPRTDPRHRIEHGMFPTASAIERMKNNKIILSTQPQWIAWYGDGWLQATNEASMNGMLPLKSMLSKGIPLAFGCDVPASIYQEPKWAFRGAILRRTSAGLLLTQNERLTIQEALRIHTMGSAYASFSEDSTGSLEPGKYADLVIWSKDLYTMTGVELNDLAAEMTIVDGKICYDAGKNPIVSISRDSDYQKNPESFLLMQNYPNPFNPITKIAYTIPQKGFVTLKIFDLLGREIKILLNEEKQPGIYQVEFNGSDLSSGVYFYELQFGNSVINKKMLLIK
jgi:predicted amidohydrolase YtcJ